jgi:hypothetical protein
MVIPTHAPRVQSTVAQTFGRFRAGLEYDALPPVVAERAKHFSLTTLPSRCTVPLWIRADQFACWLPHGRSPVAQRCTAGPTRYTRPGPHWPTEWPRTAWSWTTHFFSAQSMASRCGY